MTSRIFANNELGPDFEGRYFDHGASLFQDEISIPLIFRYPDGPMGKRVPEFVSNLDVGPTFLHLLGLGSKDDCDGRSLAGYLGLGVPPPADRVIASEGFQARSIIFGGRFKYIRSYEPTNKKIYSRDSFASRPTLYFQKEQLYDLRDDPQENRNLVSINSSLLREARRLYKDAYRVVSGFELVIQTPKDSSIEVKMPKDLAPRIREGQGTVQVENGYWMFSSGSNSLVLLALHKPDPDLIEVRVNGAQIPLRYTSMRLPLLDELDHLPAEPGGEQSLVPYPIYASAFLRRIEDREKDDRRVISSNPEFERVLREWGYLNDQ
jgi:hypothetical protein